MERSHIKINKVNPDYVQLKTNAAFSRHLTLIEKPLISDHDCQRVDIIVLKYKLPEVESMCMDHLIKHTDWPHKVTWYDARNQTANFSKLWNRLAYESTCDYICIMDSDAFVSPHWLGRMMKSFQPGFICKWSSKSDELVSFNADHPVGIVAPVTCKSGAHTRQGYEWKDKSPCLARFQISGFCFLFKKEVLDDVGYFDERFYLHGQDSEWMDRIIASKWRMVLRRDVFVDHLTSVSIQKAKQENEFNYETDILLTQRIYAIIREEKRKKMHAPPQYGKPFEIFVEEFIKEVL